MCAIVAILHYDHSPERVDRDELLRIRDRMTSRGPDGAGEWYSADGKVGLGHRRLSIIDLSDAGAQPMISPAPRSTLRAPPRPSPRYGSPDTSGNREPITGNATVSHVITFNGEIYNYKELRSQLESHGYIFRSNSDTEVLLHLYAEFGEAMVDHLRGMYAFAMWDEQKRCLFLARDPYGIKPLYFTASATSFRAASQVKALLTVAKIDLAPEPAGHVGFFLWGHVPEPYTLYAKIRALAAGETITVSSAGEIKTRHFCRVSDILSHAEEHPIALKSSESRHYLHEHLFDSVNHHLIADVTTGVFLSAGLDSTTLAALAAETKVPLRTVTLGFAEFRGTLADETPLAEITARQIGATHRTVWIGRDDFKQSYKRLLDAMDCPTTDGVNTFFISRAAVEAGLKVALSGVGGDELFGSYPSFREIPRAVRNLRGASRIPGLGKSFRTLTAPICKHFTSPKYAGLLEYGGTFGGAYLLRRGMFMPWELPDLVGPDVARAGWNELKVLDQLNNQMTSIANPHLKVAALELQNYMRNQLLRDTDWASMDSSLEIRTPLIDLPLMRAVAPLFASTSRVVKSDMARAPLKSLPEELFSRPKTGFTVPVRDWLLASDGTAQRARGLRGWALKIYETFKTV